MKDNSKIKVMIFTFKKVGISICSIFLSVKS